MYKNILFDFDGTISDTSTGIINAAKYTLDVLNIDYSKINLKDFIGPPLQDAFSNLCGLNGNENLNAIKIFRQYYKEIGLYESNLYDGIEEVLKILHNNKHDIFIASTKPTAFVEILLKKYNLQEYFKFISGSPLEGNCNPKDKTIDVILRKFNLELSNTIMIGDRKHDIIGANANNIDAIGVEYGMGTLEELKQYKPKYIAKTPKDILNFVL